jgi:hypothetical protein
VARNLPFQGNFLTQVAGEIPTQPPGKVPVFVRATAGHLCLKSTPRGNLFAVSGKLAAQSCRKFLHTQILIFKLPTNP